MNKNMLKKFTNKNGITLITLIITIVVLIILVGVAINISIGNNGIFKKAKEAKNKYNETVAREKLELILEEARIDKETINEYNKEKYLDKLLESKGIVINQNEVIVNNYNFKIDREALKVTESLGETKIKITAQVQKYLGKNESGNYEASILLVIESNNSIQKVTIENPDETTFEIQTDNLKLGKDITVEFDKEYIVKITTKDGKTESRKIIERTEEIIKTAEELAEFRDKVNTPLTYEGKIVKLGRDIDLSSICGENVNGEEISWVPIGYFKGTFDGNNYTISNIYIKSNKSNQGLFGAIANATIKNIIIDNSVIEGTNNVGVISRNSANAIIENIHTTKNNIIKATSTNGVAYVGGIIGNATGIQISKVSNYATVIGNGAYIGGIVGAAHKDSHISESYNAGNVKAYENKSNIFSIGGIIGTNAWNVEIINCYNIGTIEGYNAIGGISGSAHAYPMLTITNCYNIGTIKGSKNVGELVGERNSNSYRTINNSYTKSQPITSTNLGNAYSNDVKNTDGTWKYNNGYPILKWQVIEE